MVMTISAVCDGRNTIYMNEEILMVFGCFGS